MLQSEQFRLRISPQDKAMLARVAEHFQRSQADTIRQLVRQSYEIIKAERAGDTRPSQAQQEQAAV